MGTFWAGTYPAEGPEAAPGAGEGVWRFELDPATGRLTGRQVAAAPAPSFLATAADGAVVLAACETSPGAVVRFAVRDGVLVERERVTSGGRGPCHLLVDPRGRAVYVANYGSGSLGVLTLEPGGPQDPVRFAGGLSQVFEHSGRGPHAERQEAPHVHSTVLVPGSDVLLALDLGTDELRRYRVQPDGRLVADGVAVRMAPGTGPRHAAVTADGRLVVVGELTATVHLLDWDAATATAVEVAQVRVGTPGSDLPAHVTVDGERVLVGVRGRDALVGLRLADGGLAADGEVPTAGWPRHHALVDGWVVVAGQGADAVVSHRFRPGHGTPEPVDEAADEPVGGARVPVPACVVPA